MVLLALAGELEMSSESVLGSLGLCVAHCLLVSPVPGLFIWVWVHVACSSLLDLFACLLACFVLCLLCMLCLPCLWGCVDSFQEIHFKVQLSSSLGTAP